MAAVGVRTLAMLFGAGYGGTYLYNNMDNARSLAARVLLQHQDAERQQNANAAGTSINSNNNNNATTDALSAQMDALAREMTRSRETPVVVVGPQGSALKGSLATISDVFNLLGWAVVAVTVGGVGYYVAVRKNVSLRDLAWVSQSTFQGTVAAMQKGITRVSGAVGAVRRDLGERLRLMEGRVDTVRVSLSDKIESEVADVKTGIDGVGAEVSDVKGVLDDVNSRIEQLDTKIDTATTGIMALVRVVSSMTPGGVGQPGTPLYDLRKFAQHKEVGSIDRGAARRRLSHGGLRSLLGGGPPMGGSVDGLAPLAATDGKRDEVPRKPELGWTKKGGQAGPFPWESN